MDHLFQTRCLRAGNSLAHSRTCSERSPIHLHCLGLEERQLIIAYSRRLTRIWAPSGRVTCVPNTTFDGDPTCRTDLGSARESTMLYEASAAFPVERSATLGE